MQGWRGAQIFKNQLVRLFKTGGDRLAIADGWLKAPAGERALNGGDDARVGICGLVVLAAHFPLGRHFKLIDHRELCAFGVPLRIEFGDRFAPQRACPPGWLACIRPRAFGKVAVWWYRR